MLIFPAIDIQNRQCVRLVKGDFATAHRVAEDPLATAQAFRQAGAENAEKRMTPPPFLTHQTGF